MYTYLYENLMKNWNVGKRASLNAPLSPLPVPSSLSWPIYHTIWPTYGFSCSSIPNNYVYFICMVKDTAITQRLRYPATYYYIFYHSVKFFYYHGISSLLEVVTYFVVNGKRVISIGINFIWPTVQYVIHVKIQIYFYDFLFLNFYYEEHCTVHLGIIVSYGNYPFAIFMEIIPRIKCVPLFCLIFLWY